MSIDGLYMLKNAEYSKEKINEAIKILYTDRKNEFQELTQVILGEKRLKEMSNWKRLF